MDKAPPVGPVPALTYRLCAHCARTVPTASGEQFCVNDGLRMLDACPVCSVAITSPYARFCAVCGAAFTSAAS